MKALQLQQERAEDGSLVVTLSAHLGPADAAALQAFSRLHADLAVLLTTRKPALVGDEDEDEFPATNLQRPANG